MPKLGEFFEREAVAIYSAFGLDCEEGMQVIGVAKALGMEVLETDKPMPGEVRLGLGKRIWVRRGLCEKRVTFGIGHEVAAWLLREMGYRCADVEERENRLAACLLLPRPAIAATLRGHAWHGVREFAGRLGVSETCAALRLGEATGDPVAVVTRTGTRLRGDAWPFDESPEQLARARRVPDGLFRTRIEKSRIVLCAA